MQHITLIALLALVAVVSANHSLIIGEREPGDYLIEQKEVEKRGWPLLVVEKTETILGDGDASITQIEVIDIKQKETSATPAIISGGPGQSYVTIKFVSERGHGISFLLKVYGKSSVRTRYSYL